MRIVERRVVSAVSLMIIRRTSSRLHPMNTRLLLVFDEDAVSTQECSHHLMHHISLTYDDPVRDWRMICGPNYFNTRAMQREDIDE
jgi:hypothetical protein